MSVPSREVGFDFQDRDALVVGGSSGIGNGIAQRFRRAGANVSVWGTRPAASDYADVEGSDLSGLSYASVDVAEPAEIAEAAARFDALDVLVLSQGITRPGGAEFEAEGWDRVIAVNLSSLMYCATAFLPLLAARSGAIVVVSSVSAVRAHADMPAYTASKAGALHLTRSLALAWARKGVRVNGVAPGFVETKLTAAAAGDPSRRAANMARIPAGRFGTPDDMADATMFLASPLASYVNGQTLFVDGGLTL